MTQIHITSWGTAFGPPPGNRPDKIIQCRGVRNPAFVPNLYQLTGMDKAVSDNVFASDFAHDLLDQAVKAVEDFAEEDDFYHIRFTCSKGKHRSVALAEALKSELDALGYPFVTVEHLARENWPTS